MEMAIKEYLANFQEKVRTPLRVYEIRRAKENGVNYIYIITNREAIAKEGLKLALMEKTLYPLVSSQKSDGKGPA